MYTGYWVYNIKAVSNAMESEAVGFLEGIGYLYSDEDYEDELVLTEEDGKPFIDQQLIISYAIDSFYAHIFCSRVHKMVVEIIKMRYEVDIAKRVILKKKQFHVVSEKDLVHLCKKEVDAKNKEEAKRQLEAKLQHEERERQREEKLQHEERERQRVEKRQREEKKLREEKERQREEKLQHEEKERQRVEKRQREENRQREAKRKDEEKQRRRQQTQNYREKFGEPEEQRQEQDKLDENDSGEIEEGMEVDDVESESIAVPTSDDDLYEGTDELEANKSRGEPSNVKRPEMKTPVPAPRTNAKSPYTTSRNDNDNGETIGDDEYV